MEAPPAKIANITFAFANAKLIDLLRQRGALVAAGQFGKLPPVDIKINEMKTHDLQSLTKPVAAFITFETQDGFERACEFKGKTRWNGDVVSDREFDGCPLYFEEAPEPTNIIWEHRQNTAKKQLIKTAVVSVIIVFLLFLAFMAFYTLKQQTVANYKKYPPTTNCNSLYTDFSVAGTPGVITPIPVSTNIIFAKTAYSDKILIKNYGTGTGVYQCYCTALEKEIGTSAVFKTPCKMYVEDFFGGKALSQVVSISIVVINLVLRAIMLVLIKWIGYHTESEQTASIMTSIFIVQFFKLIIGQLRCD